MANKIRVHTPLNSFATDSLGKKKKKPIKILVDITCGFLHFAITCKGLNKKKVIGKRRERLESISDYVESVCRQPSLIRTHTPVSTLMLFLFSHAMDWWQAQGLPYSKIKFPIHFRHTHTQIRMSESP